LIEIILHDDAFDEVLSALIEAGAKYDFVYVSDAGEFSFHDLTFKRYRYVPTAEDTARHEAYLKTPFGVAMTAILKVSAEKIAGMVTKPSPFVLSAFGSDGVRTELKIRLPNDYAVNPLDHEQTK